MQDIEKLIKHHDFPEEGTLSLTRLKVVRDSVEQSSDKQPGCCCKCVKHVCKKCEQTVDCWLKEADKRERKQMQKELAGRKNEKCESLSACGSAPPEPTNPQYVCVSPHENTVRPAPPDYKTHIYPMAQLGALKFDPDLHCSPPRQPQQDAQARAARDAEWTSTSSARRWMNKHEQRETLNKWHERQRKQRERQRKKCGLCVQVMNMTFLPARSAGCARTTDTGHRIVQRCGRWIETRGTENRRGEGEWQAFSQLRKREVKMYWHTHTTRSHTLIQILLSAMKNMLATLYVWLRKFWIMLLLMNVWECTKV